MLEGEDTEENEIMCCHKEPIEYLGATFFVLCISNSSKIWTSNTDNVVGKIQKRLKIMSVKRLNVARIIIQSKINSIPRYLSGLNVITKKKL